MLCLSIYLWWVRPCLPQTNNLRHNHISSLSQVELERTTEKAADCKVHIQEMEEQLNIVGQNMKALEASETAALKSHEDYEESIR